MRALFIYNIMSKYLILPDIHGRNFWEEACINHENDYDKIIFLGDYVSPYPTENISNEQAIETLEYILSFKRRNLNKTVLLLGNHDFSYFNPELCNCRTDYDNWQKLHNLYEKNLDLFDLAYEVEDKGIRYFFSHAGVRKEWFEKYVRDRWFNWNDDTLPKADYFNNTLHCAYKNEDLKEIFEGALGVCSHYRDYDGGNVGSIIWADAREFSKPEYIGIMFICGHTQLRQDPIVTLGFADLDCRKPFMLDTDTQKLTY